MRVGGLGRFNLHGCRLVGQRTDQGVPVAILGDGDGDLGLDDRVDTSDCKGQSRMTSAGVQHEKVRSGCYEPLLATSQAHSKRRAFLTSRFGGSSETTDMVER